MNKLAKTHLNNALEQLKINSISTDKYACLELRQCLEALTYQKIKAYKDRISDSITSQWRPAQVMTMLEELEPCSTINKNIDIKFTMDNHELHKKIIQNEITSSFIKNCYHKLGSYLHVPIKEINNKSDLHTYLVKLTEEIKPYLDNEVYSTMAKVNKFKCSEKGCNQEFIRNADSIKVGDIISCFNPNCKAEYIIKEKKENEYMTKLHEAIIECNCGNEMHVASYKLKNDKYLYTCKECQSKYVITKAYKMEIDNE
ncbi:MAG: hypothetical protein A2513_03190 [Sulfurimonas sp. RIFOXYD12_FULL_33_39]|uniref:hypothetical protein n=1 Tax=unclassified Sulfurimonas TaxID=2623549 RepID=UPI0008B5B86E|nr:MULTISPECIES: hypothetical protein [unclassified Sulfurimonas]OHE08996.1 MAG: hypothetical protein A2513_03190 [Sulfurimonas sp. RIFOXYD12_FULL_33_39]OHE14306.1 MAG: hypothetical protein A2530_06490 [Sulfurimonas sp. RIFOXYD2_FULL_34_21]